MRIPYAMRAMIDEIAKTHEDAVFETQSPDGFGVWRTLVVDSETTETFTVLLDELLDPRISRKSVDTDGRYYVTFVSDKRADDATPFYLDKALAVLNGDGAITIEDWVAGEGLVRTTKEAEERRKELGRITVEILRSSYTLQDGTEFSAKDKKRDIIDAILTDEGF